jgi:hypothetical protein
METKKKRDDNKSLREKSTKSLLASAISIGKNTLTEREHSILLEVLVNQKTFSELAEHFQLTPLRLKMIFQNGEKRLNRLFKGIHDRVIAYDEMEKELKTLRKQLSLLETEADKKNKISPELKALLALPVNSLDFSPRVTKVFTDHDINTVADIVKRSRRDFIMLRNFGGKSMRELEDFVNSKKLHWNMDV